MKKQGIFKFSNHVNVQIIDMLQPKRTKHRKAQKGRIRKVMQSVEHTIAFGSYGIESTGTNMVNEPAD